MAKAGRIAKRMFYVTIICLIQIGYGLSQTSEPTELERRKADAEARIAEAHARTAEAHARTADANSRSSQIANRKAELDLLAANTSVTGDLIENDISAYKAVSCAASEINKRISRLGNQIDVLMIYSPRFARTIAEYSFFINQLDAINAKYDSAFRDFRAIARVRDSSNREKEPRVLAGMSMVDPINQIRALAIDTLSLFKTDVEIAGRTVLIGKDEFISKVVSGLAMEVYYPEKMIALEPNSSSKLISTLLILAGQRIESRNILATDPTDTDIVNRLEGLNEVYDGIISRFSGATNSPAAKSATDSNEASYKPRNISFVDFMRADLAYGIMTSNDQRKKYWLDVHVTKAGSNQRKRTSPVIDIFKRGKRMSFSGGAIVNFRIFNSSGRMLASDTILTYVPFNRSTQIAGYKCLNVETLP